MEESTRFIIKKLPEIPNFEEFYNVQIGSDEFIVDKKNLLKLKSDLDQLLH